MSYSDSNHDEHALFLAEMLDVQPLHATTLPETSASESTITPGQVYRRQLAEQSDGIDTELLSLYLKHMLHADEWLTFERGGLQKGVFRKLRLGRYNIDATLNLQACLPEQARGELIRFIEDCAQQDVRTVLMRLGTKPQHRATIKSYLAQWLPQLPAVMAFHTAQKHHGGNQALYVLLKKGEQSRQKNREHFARR